MGKFMQSIDAKLLGRNDLWERREAQDFEDEEERGTAPFVA